MDQKPSSTLPLVEFRIGPQHFGLRLPDVERIVHMAAIRPLAGAPEVVLGLLDYHGRFLPVYDFRKRFDLPPRRITPDQVLILAHAGARLVAIAADEVVGSSQCLECDIQPASGIVASLPHLEGLVKLGGEVVFIHDLATFLFAAESSRLDQSLLESKGMAS